jgi:hypothetical protein
VLGLKYTTVGPESNTRLVSDRFDFSNESKAIITERSLDTVAWLGSSDLDGLRAGYRDSDNLVAGDKDDLAAVAARRCWVVVAALR